MSHGYVAGTPDFYAERERRRKRFVQRFGAVQKDNRPCIRRLFGKYCGYRRGHEPFSQIIDKDGFPCHPPGCDHESFWYKDGNPFAFVYQPYGLSDDNRTRLYALADRIGLDVFIDSDLSWHYPGSTILIVLTRKV